ncbi:MAG: UDP-3-O-(3-hydroxymyristoyl)glucosamine N-acyltransferase [Cyclobacteriaceae bacterium]|nr:UDP-3-O-(3-hydroxymyristoyl)glucosamine N-acyltransferase [Cyclobacteriaceae bacterium]
MEFTAEQIAALLGGKLEGDGNQRVHTLQPIESALEGSITFLSNPKYEPHLYTTQASIVIISQQLELKKAVTAAVIRVENPYASFTALLEEYQKLIAFQKTGIESPSFIHESAQLGRETYVGAFAYIGQNVKIGNQVKIYPHVYIGDNITIGSNTILYPGAKLYSGTKIGSYCTIQAGAVIGSDGFGFAPQEDGSYKAIPQLGNVVIEDHVDIGANTVIDCATFDSTIIRKGVKLDNLIQIAHNVEIGEHTAIAAQSGIAGSAKVGKQCIIGGQVGVAGHIQIANRSKIQAQSGISKANIEGGAWYGSPGIEYSNYVRSYSIFRKLPDVMKRIEQLEEKILNLPTKE